MTVNVILMGPPGVGKGTQGQRLAADYGVPVVATGDMFREIGKDDTPLAREVLSYMEQGEYVPDELTIKLALDRLNQKDALPGFVLDGFPRTVNQAESLDKHLAEEGRKLDSVILLVARREVILERLTGRRVCSNCGLVYNNATQAPKVSGVCDICGGRLVQRTDESPNVQARRLDVYERQTAPVAAYYRDSGRLAEVDATQSVDAVQVEIKKVVEGSEAA